MSTEANFREDPQAFLAERTDELEEIAEQAEAEGDDMKAALCRGTLRWLKGESDVN